MHRASRRSGPILVVIGSIVVVALGCADVPPTAVTDEATVGARSARTDLFNATPASSTIDDAFASLVDVVPGFGGVFVDIDGVVNVHLTDPAFADRAPQAVATFARTYDMPGLEQAVARGIRVHAAAFDFRSLLQWKRALLHNAGIADVMSFDVDERVNRVVVGVTNAEAAANVARIARDLDIPEGAVLTETVAPTELRATLQDSTTRVAGLGIGIGNVPTCTMGAIAFTYYNGNAVDSSTAYMITATHCGASWFALDHGWIGQPTIARSIAYEVADPATFTNAQSPLCPVLFLGLPARCRYSDASLYTMTGASNPFWHGTIYTTPGLNNINITDSRSIATAGYPYVGQVVNKTGMKSGFTSGSVTNSCTDRLHSNIPGMSSSYVLLCQGIASVRSEGGDSGSPVYGPLTGYPHLYNPVAYVGILWGGPRSLTGTQVSDTSYFSPWPQVRLDLGGNLAITR